MSLEFFREKRFQRRHPDVFCKRMALTIPCVSSLRVTPHQVLKSFHCSLQLDQLGTSRRKNFSEQSSRSSSRQGSIWQSVRRHHNFCRCIRFCHCCRFSFHCPRQDISRSRVHIHDEVLCTSCPRYELTLRVLQRWRLSQTFRIHQGRIGSCWICCGQHCRSHCLRKRLW